MKNALHQHRDTSAADGRFGNRHIHNRTPVGGCHAGKARKQLGRSVIAE